MKIRHPALIRAVGRLGSWVLRGWMRTQRYHFVGLAPDLNPNQPGLRARYLYAFWHEYILMPAYEFGRPEICVLVSTHADGQMIAEVCARMGFSLARGSTTRGGVQAVRQMLRDGGAKHLAVTPDGPGGPRRQVQPGVAFLASRTGLPVVPFGVGNDRPWRLKSWDRFCLPRPGRRAVVVMGEPIRVPADADRGALEHYRTLIELALTDLTALAERWATAGVPAEYRRSRPKAV